MPHTQVVTREHSKVLALHGFLDQRAETVITRMWEHAGALDVDIHKPPEGVRPHLTLGSWELDDVPAGLAERTATALGAIPRVTLNCTVRLAARQQAHFSLAPLIQHDLLNWHEDIHRRIGAIGTPRRAADFPGHWNPHITLFNCEEEDLPSAYDLLKTLPLPLKAEVVSAGLLLYARHEPVRSLISVSIGGG
ncbi:MAG: hypothetical protein GF331_23650 [Chitinivibrionales bacterium]|nr:hypothetical protein [Chitinivibrionales bacterium]